jgi:hypothetical protein
MLGCELSVVSLNLDEVLNLLGGCTESLPFEDGCTKCFWVILFASSKSSSSSSDDDIESGIILSMSKSSSLSEHSSAIRGRAYLPFLEHSFISSRWSVPDLWSSLVILLDSLDIIFSSDVFC